MSIIDKLGSGRYVHLVVVNEPGDNGLFVDNVKDVSAFLVDYPNELKFYQQLTPGYQVDWARYIYSAKQQKTREKRQAQMVDILSQGYKTIDRYRQNKK